jgi:hypothetical protein
MEFSQLHQNIIFNLGTILFNYKGYYSIVLLALIDVDYKFTVNNVGSYKRNNDGGIFLIFIEINH